MFAWVRRLLLLCLVIYQPNVFAVTSGLVKRIFPTSDGAINFQLKNDACNAAYKYYKFDSSTVSGKNWYSLLLASAASGTEVKLRFVGDDVACDPSVNKEIIYLYVDY